LWLGEDIKTAIDKPRLHHQLAPMVVSFEDGVDVDLVDFLASVDHVVEEDTLGSVVSAVVRTADGRLQANSDGRRDSGVDGF